MIRKFTLLVMILAVAACADKTNNKPTQTVFQDQKTDGSKTSDKDDANKDQKDSKAAKSAKAKAKAHAEAKAKAEQEASVKAARAKAEREAAAHRPAPAPVAAAPVVTSLERPQGDFRSTGEDSGAEARISGCSYAPARLDDRVKAGTAFQIEDKWTAREGGFGGYGKVRKGVDAVDAHGNRLDLTLNVQGLKGWYKQTCNYVGDTNGQMTATCNFTSSSFGNTPGAGTAKTPKVCSIAWDAKHKTMSKVETGTYVMRGGRVVNAVRATRVEEGSLNCDDQDLGKGTVEAVTIYSADVPDIEHPSCGNGTKVFYDEVAKNSSGTVVNSKKFEIISY